MIADRTVVGCECSSAFAFGKTRELRSAPTRLVIRGMCRHTSAASDRGATVRLHVVVPDGGRGAAAEAQAAENPSDATDTAAKCQLPGDRVVRCDDRERTRRGNARGSRRVRRGRGAVCRTASDSKPIRTPLSPLRTRDRAACCIVDAFPSTSRG